MTFKKPIYRILFFAGWLIILCGIVVLSIAANRKNKDHLCAGVEVTINGGGDKIYIKPDDIQKSIGKAAKGSLIKKHFGEINLTLLEKTLEANRWIRDAELYFDSKDILHVAVLERKPVARVFNTAGSSFYMDSLGYTMPLLENYSLKLPVITGFTATKKWTVRDSATVSGIRNITRYMETHPFWNAQIGQIDITPAGKFELVPVIGSHIIKLGYGENVEEKLARLFLFYKSVLPTAGLAKYSALDVQFDGQVIGVKGNMQSPIDSLQLQKNILELMRKKATEQEAEGMLPDESLPIAIAPVVAVKRDSVNGKPAKKVTQPIVRKVANISIAKKPITLKSNSKKSATQKTEVQKPKAVMQKQQ